MHTLQALTLAQMEAQDTAWAAGLAAAYTDCAERTLYPFGNRESLEVAMSVSWKDIKADRLRHRVITTRWPELLTMPFNKQSMRSAVRARARRERYRAVAAARKARRLVARQSPGY